MSSKRKTIPRLRRTAKSTMKAVYLKPGLPEDDLLAAVWDASSRPTQLFRTLLLQGVKRMVERGELPYQVAKDHSVQRQLGVLGELSPAAPAQVLPAARPVAPPLQPAPAELAPPVSEPATTSSQPSPQKDSLPRRVGLDASLM
ncbi:hypothetical protein ACVIGB_001075 [Bradyrhizobium sp. USDA 4341]